MLTAEQAIFTPVALAVARIYAQAIVAAITAVALDHVVYLST